MQVLVIDDDEALGVMLTDALNRVGYRVETAADGLTGLSRACTTLYDLILLEVVLPGLDGYSICRQLRRKSTVPIIFVSARNDEADRIAGLAFGADDYVGKPFSLGELLARVESVLRRYRSPPTQPERNVLTAGDLLLDLGSHRLFRGEVEINITRKDFALLASLMRGGGNVLSREMLQQSVWGTHNPVAARTIDVHIRWLRSKIEPDPARPRYIETVPGIGYRINRNILGSSANPEA